MRKLFCVCLIFLGSTSHAFKASSFSAGVDLYWLNTGGKMITDTGTNFLFEGTLIFPVRVKYDWAVLDNWFLSPEFALTLLTRNSPGDTMETRLVQVLFPIGTNLYTENTFTWDWQLGPGINYYLMEGAGGTQVLSNGTGTATFARPGRSVTATTAVLNLGTSLNFDASRVRFGIVAEGALSEDKRNLSYMIGYLHYLE